MIHLYELYISHRPNNCKLNDFHLACINKPTSSTWYKGQPLGIHQIERVTKNLMSRIGKSGHFTNTSLRRTAKTRLVEAGIPREVIKKRMGHISEADEVYIHERVMEKKMGRILSNSTSQIVSTQSSSASFYSRQEQEEGNDVHPRSITFNSCSFTNCTF